MTHHTGCKNCKHNCNKKYTAKFHCTPKDQVRIQEKYRDQIFNCFDWAPKPGYTGK